MICLKESDDANHCNMSDAKCDAKPARTERTRSETGESTASSALRKARRRAALSKLRAEQSQRKVALKVKLAEAQLQLELAELHVKAAPWQQPEAKRQQEEEWLVTARQQAEARAEASRQQAAREAQRYRDEAEHRQLELKLLEAKECERLHIDERPSRARPPAEAPRELPGQLHELPPTQVATRAEDWTDRPRQHPPLFCETDDRHLQTGRVTLTVTGYTQPPKVEGNNAEDRPGCVNATVSTARPAPETAIKPEEMAAIIRQADTDRTHEGQVQSSAASSCHERTRTSPTCAVISAASDRPPTGGQRPPEAVRRRRRRQQPTSSTDDDAKTERSPPGHQLRRAQPGRPLSHAGPQRTRLRHKCRPPGTVSVPTCAPQSRRPWEPTQRRRRPAPRPSAAVRRAAIVPSATGRPQWCGEATVGRVDCVPGGSLRPRHVTDSIRMRTQTGVIETGPGPGPGRFRTRVWWQRVTGRPPEVPTWQ